ncbi:hypothetical protein PO909_028957 [Leuciscus waleckii]
MLTESRSVNVESRGLAFLEASVQLPKAFPPARVIQASSTETMGYSKTLWICSRASLHGWILLHLLCSVCQINKTKKQLKLFSANIKYLVSFRVNGERVSACSFQMIIMPKMEENIVCGNRVLSPSGACWPICVCVFLEHMALCIRLDFWKVMQRLVKRFYKTLRVQCEIHYGPVILVHVAVRYVYFENEKVKSLYNLMSHFFPRLICFFSFLTLYWQPISYLKLNSSKND